MKKLLLTLALFLTSALVVQAAPISWDLTSNVAKLGVAGYNAVIKGAYFTATSTTATSTFPNASTTNLVVSSLTNQNCIGTNAFGLTIPGTCSGGAISNMWNSFIGYISPATSTDGIVVNGSSTISNLTMSRSTTTNATTTNLYISGNLSTASGTTLNNGGYNKRGNNNQIPIVISEMAANWGDFYGRGTIAFSGTIYKSGTSSLAITAANTGLNTGARYNIPDYDGSKDNYVFWVRSDNWSQVNTAEFLISTAGTFTDTYTVDLKNFLVAPPNNEWIEMVVPRTNFTRSSAAANWATVNDMLLRITSTNTPTVWIDRLSRVKQQTQPLLAVVFDDAWQTQYTAAKPIMDAYAIPGTAYVIWNAIGTSQYMTEAQLADTADDGWDIGGHGAINLTTLTPAQVESDLQNMKLFLNQRGYRGAENYALPNGAYNSSTLPIVRKYFATQRTIDSLANTTNYMNADRVSAFSPSQFTSTSTLYTRVDNAVANNDFLVITFHNIVDVPSVDTDFSTEKFRQFIAYVASSSIKTVTMSAAMDYDDSFATKNDTGIAIGTSTPSASLTIWGNSILTKLFNIFSQTGTTILTVLSNGNVGVGTSTPSAQFTVAGDMRLTGAFGDSASSTGALGMVLQSTGVGTQWVATSSLGIVGGGGSGTVYLASSTPSFSVGNIAFITGPGTLGGLATTTLSFNGGLSANGTPVILGASPLTVTGTTYLATTSTWTNGNLARVASNGTVDSVATSSLGFRESNWVDQGVFLTPLTASDGIVLTGSSTAMALRISALRDSANNLGTIGQVLQSNGSTAQWVSTSSLGISGGTGLSDPLTTDGDIIARVSGATTRLAQGSNGQFLGVSGGVLGYYTPSGSTNYFTSSGNNTFLNTGINLQAPTFQATSTTGTSTFAGAVGIGSSTPQATLAIQPTIGVVPFMVSSTTQPATPPFMIDATGNSLFGTNVAQVENSRNAFVTFNSSSSDDAYVTFKNGSAGKVMGLVIRATGSNYVNTVYSGTGARWVNGQVGSTDYNIWDDSGAGVPVVAIKQGNTRNRLTVSSAGLIGISTTTPGAMLEMWVSTSTIPLNIASSSGASMMTILPNGNVGIGTTSPGALFSVGSSTWNGLHISSLGKVGIGCINNTPGLGSFGCGTNANVNTNISFIVQDPTDARMGASVNNQGVFIKSSGGLYAYDYTAGAGRVLNLNEFGGNVGVGSSSPQGTFAIQGVPGISPFVVASSTGAEIFRISSTSFVGIGSTTPTTVLSVNGTTTTNNLRIYGLPGTRALFLDASGNATSTAASASLSSALSDETGTGVAVFGTAPTFTTNITAPLHIGGSAVTSVLTLQSTSGAGTSDQILFKTGNNGNKLAVTIESMGQVEFGTTTASTTAWVTVASTTATRAFYVRGTTTLDGITTIFPVASTTAAFALCAGPNATGTGSNILDCGATPTADYAEAYAVTPGIAFGDILMATGDMVHQTNGIDSPRLAKATQGGVVIGIASDNFGDFTSTGHGAFENETTMPVALNGRVLVKVNHEGGTIFVGDKIGVSSVPGIGKKATEAGEAVVGTALSPEKNGQVLVFVANTIYKPSILAMVKDVQKSATDNWQTMGLLVLFLLVAAQQYQIYKLKK